MSRVTRLHRVIRDLQALLTIQSHPRPWHMPLVAALATGLPLFLGAFTDTMAYAVLASIGGLIIIYMPQARLVRRYPPI